MALPDKDIESNTPSATKEPLTNINSGKNRAQSWWDWFFNEETENTTPDQKLENQFLAATTRAQQNDKPTTNPTPSMEKNTSNIQNPIMYKWSFKIIGGISAGTYQELENGQTYVLGASVSNTHFLIRDFGVSNTHASIQISQDGTQCYIKDLNSKNGLIKNGEIVPSNTDIQINSNDVIELGFAKLIIIDRTQPIKTVSIKMQDPGNINETTDDIMHIAANKTRMFPGNVRDLKVNVDTAVAVFILQKMKTFAIKILPFGAFLFCMSTIVFIVGSLCYHSFQEHQVETLSVDIKTQVEEVLSEFKHVDFFYNQHTKTLLLTGWLTTNSEMDTLYHKITSIKDLYRISNEIVVNERIGLEINELLGGNPQWEYVNININQPGQIEIYGYVTTKKDYDFLTSNINNVDFSCKIVNNVTIEEKTDALISTLIQKYQLHNVIAYTYAWGEITIIGSIAEQQKSVLEKLISSLYEIKGIKIVENITTILQEDITSIRDISHIYKITGHILHTTKGQIVIINGKMYTVGDILDGMTISEINSNQVFLEKNKKKFCIYKKNERTYEKQ